MFSKLSQLLILLLCLSPTVHADSSLEQAKREYDLLNLDKALSLLTDYETQLTKDSSLVPSSQILAELNLYFGATQFFLGQETKARAYFKQAFLYNNKLLIPQKGFGGSLFSLLRIARQEAASPSIGYLTVYSYYKEGHVWVDGREIGKAPLVQTPLAIGQHLVQVTTADNTKVSGFVNIDENAETPFLAIFSN